MEGTKAKTSIAEDSRKRGRKEEEEESIRRITRGEWMRMSAGLAISERQGRIERKKGL